MAKAKKPAAKRKPTKPAPKAKKQAAKAQPKRAAKAKTKAAPKAKTKSAPRARKPASRAKQPARRAKPAARRPQRKGGEVMRILEAKQPIAALRAFLDGIGEVATVQQGQIALGAAQLMLLPIAREHRGGSEVKELLDLVLAHWERFPDRTGFHAQELLRNAFAAVGDDRARVTRLVRLVPLDASPELRFNVACALAVTGERDAMLRAVETAISAGASAAQFERDHDFDAYREDPGFRSALERASAPVIPIDVVPHLGPIRAALDGVVRTLREYGEVAKLQAPASLDDIRAAERAAKIQLPNDYRAFLTTSDGMTAWEHAFFGTIDYRGETKLAKQAREFLAMSSGYGATGIDECVPLANLGQPNNWLLYDPRGRIRGGVPGYVQVLTADAMPIDGLTDAFAHLERLARDVFGTN